ncbi:MAG: chemotaxis protein CheX [Sediminispirochaetaceae bacterium]
MEEAQVKEALSEATTGTFADMTFLDVLEDEEHLPFEAGQLLFIEFDRPIYGRLILTMPLELKQMIVENIHATDWEELSVSEIDDCLLEVLNVLAGSFLRALHREDIKVRLSFPHVMFSYDEVPDLNTFDVYHFHAEGTPFTISLALHVEG